LSIVLEIRLTRIIWLNYLVYFFILNLIYIYLFISVCFIIYLFLNFINIRWFWWVILLLWLFSYLIFYFLIEIFLLHSVLSLWNTVYYTNIRHCIIFLVEGMQCLNRLLFWKCLSIIIYFIFATICCNLQLFFLNNIHFFILLQTICLLVCFIIHIRKRFLLIISLISLLIYWIFVYWLNKFNFIALYL
jgi:hypothetical protein